MELWEFGMGICMFLAVFSVGFIAGSDHGYTEGLQENDKIDRYFIQKAYHRGIIEGIKLSRNHIEKRLRNKK